MTEEGSGWQRLGRRLTGRSGKEGGAGLAKMDTHALSSHSLRLPKRKGRHKDKG